MNLRSLLLAAALTAGFAASPALADPPRDNERVFEDTRKGRAMPLPQLERRVMPFMDGADYLGPEINGGTYRLKFVRDGRVIWVDVDARTGRILRKSRPKGD